MVNPLFENTLHLPRDRDLRSPELQQRMQDARDAQTAQRRQQEVIHPQGERL